jgi:molecular chaperone GrpE
LDRAFSIFKNNEKFKDKEFLEITSGIELIEKELQNTLEKNFITYIDCLNKKFDPNFHQALSEVESDKEPGTIIDEIQKGYMLHDRLLRPSLVNVAKSTKKS